MRTLHLVSHTHWDREWYLTFQQFRIKLVHLVDNLLETLDSDPEYRHFMLDGQTIVLDDYLAIRPEAAETIAGHVQSGRVLIGPWHILPDEFLVSPEATVRNLLQGERTARQFGPKMRIGYVPDPFGHISQLPQILRGFGIETAAFRRGLSDEPCELWWQAPDGSRVLVLYLRDGYDNAARLPASDASRFGAEVQRLRDSLIPHTATSHILLMHGTDHMESPPGITQALRSGQDKLDGDILVHSTLPAYAQAVQAEIGGIELPVVQGELRASRRHHLLPAVLSARMWIKQRNHACENLMEKWVEPFSAWAGLASDPGQAIWVATGHQDTPRIGEPEPLVRHTWRMLMECHPHDSICGCSIDQVHDEMRVRFDQVEQAGAELVRQSLEALAETADTRQPGAAAQPSSALLIFNPAAGPRTDNVIASVQLPAGVDRFEIVDEAGKRLLQQVEAVGSHEISNVTVDRDGLQSMLGMVQGGSITGTAIRDVTFRREGSRLFIDIALSQADEPNPVIVERALRDLSQWLADETLDSFPIRVRTAAATRVRLVAPDVPGHGYRTFWVRPAPPVEADTLPFEPSVVPSMENEYLAVELSPIDGTLTIRDKRTGQVYEGLNRFVDGGDCGDEYNYCPPWRNELVDSRAAHIVSLQTEQGAARQSVQVTLVMRVPAGLTLDRQGRVEEPVILTITTQAALTPGVPRVDVTTRVENTARDHRLRVHFPAPLAASEAHYDGHFDVARRPVGVPPFDESWVEEPRPEVPQRAFTDVSDGRHGLMLAARGLPEVEVIARPDETSEIALTLLRCVGWLSRNDLSTRQGAAGPSIPTPGAQMMGSWEFEYSILPHAGDWLHSGAFRQAYAFDAPLHSVAASIHSGSLPPAASLVQTGPDAFVVSACKAPEEGQGLIVRGYNIGSDGIQARLTPWRPFRHAARVRLDETEVEPLAMSADGSVTFPVHGHEIVTVRWTDQG